MTNVQKQIEDARLWKLINSGNSVTYSDDNSFVTMLLKHQTHPSFYEISFDNKQIYGHSVYINENITIAGMGFSKTDPLLILLILSLQDLTMFLKSEDSQEAYKLFENERAVSGRIRMFLSKFNFTNIGSVVTKNIEQKMSLLSDFKFKRGIFGKQISNNRVNHLMKNMEENIVYLKTVNTAYFPNNMKYRMYKTKELYDIVTQIKELFHEVSITTENYHELKEYSRLIEEYLNIVFYYFLIYTSRVNDIYTVGMYFLNMASDISDFQRKIHHLSRLSFDFYWNKTKNSYITSASFPLVKQTVNNILPKISSYLLYSPTIYGNSLDPDTSGYDSNTDNEYVFIHDKVMNINHIKKRFKALQSAYKIYGNTNYRLINEMISLAGYMHQQGEMDTYQYEQILKDFNKEKPQVNAKRMSDNDIKMRYNQLISTMNKDEAIVNELFSIAEYLYKAGDITKIEYNNVIRLVDNAH